MGSLVDNLRELLVGREVVSVEEDFRWRGFAVRFLLDDGSVVRLAAHGIGPYQVALSCEEVKDGGDKAPWVS